MASPGNRVSPSPSPSVAVVALSAEEWVQPANNRQISPAQFALLKGSSKGASALATPSSTVSPRVSHDGENSGAVGKDQNGSAATDSRSKEKKPRKGSGLSSSHTQAFTDATKKEAAPAIPASSGSNNSGNFVNSCSPEGPCTPSNGLSRSSGINTANAKSKNANIVENSWDSVDSYRAAVAAAVAAGGVNAGENGRRNTAPSAAGKPEPPPHGPNADLFRRTFSVTDASRGDPSSNGGRGGNHPGAFSTPPPTQPASAAIPVSPHPSSAPRDRRPSQLKEEQGQERRAETPRAPRPKAPFYAKPFTPTPTPSATPTLNVSPRTPPDLLRSRSGSQAAPNHNDHKGRDSAAALVGDGDSASGAALPPLVPQDSRSGLPRTLGSQNNVSNQSPQPQPQPQSSRVGGASIPPLTSSAAAKQTSTAPRQHAPPEPRGSAGSGRPSATTTSPSPAPTPAAATGERPPRSESPGQSRQPPAQPASGLTPRSSSDAAPGSGASPPRAGNPSSAGPGPAKPSPRQPPPTQAKASATPPKTTAPPAQTPRARPPSATAPSSAAPPAAAAAPAKGPPKKESVAAPAPQARQQQPPALTAPTATAKSASGVAAPERVPPLRRSPPPLPTPLTTKTAKPKTRPSAKTDLDDLSAASDILDPSSALVGFRAMDDGDGSGEAKAKARGTSPAPQRPGAADAAAPAKSSTPALLKPYSPPCVQAPPALAAAKAAPPARASPTSESPKPSALANRSSVRPAPSSSSHEATDKRAATASEAAALATYLGEEELNLSMSTFTTLGTALSHSLALRVLNLRGSTMASEGLSGLADIPTLQSICVSHMRKLTSLQPLITPTRSNQKCGLQEIDAQCTPLNNEGLAGLEKLPRLRKLDLSMTAVTDVSLLSASVSLKELYLALTHVTSDGLRGFDKIPTLVTLNVSRTKVTSLKTLIASRSLQTLLLYSCKTTDEDLKGVEQMPRLAVIDLSTTKVTDLSIFRSSPSLQSIKAQWLSLKNCVDLIQERRASMNELGGSSGAFSNWQEAEAGYAGLAKVPTLETVDLSFNSIRSIHSLCRSTSIKHLILRRTRVDSAGVAEIHRLARTLETLEITNLTDSIEENSDDDMLSAGGSVTCSGNGMLCNVNVLARLTKLTKIDLSYTDVFDLRVLRRLPLLKELVIVETLVTVDGLRGIEEIPALETLDLSQTSVLSLQFLAGGARALKRVLVKSNRNVRGFRLGHIEGLPSLESLDISDTVVEDIRMMWTPNWPLKELIWRWRERREAVGPVAPLECWVTSERLAGLASMPCLEKLDIANSVVQNLDFLVGAPKITSLNLDGCRLLRDPHIATIGREAFVRDTLESLNLANNPYLTDLTCLSRCKRLHTLCITNDTGLHVPGLEGVWNLPTIKELDIVNSGAEETLWRSQQADMNAALEGSARATSHSAAATNVSGGSDSGRSGANAPPGHRGGGGGGAAGDGDDSAEEDGANTKRSRGGHGKRGDGNGSSGGSKHGGGGGGSGGASAADRPGDAGRQLRHGKTRKEEGTLRDVSAVLDSSAAPVQFRVPRRRRVSFVMVDAGAPATEGGRGAALNK